MANIGAAVWVTTGAEVIPPTGINGPMWQLIVGAIIQTSADKEQNKPRRDRNGIPMDADCKITVIPSSHYLCTQYLYLKSAPSCYNNSAWTPVAEPVTGCLARGGRVTRPSLLLPLRSGRDWAGGERRDTEGGTTLGGAGAASTHTILVRRRGQEQDSDDT